MDESRLLLGMAAVFAGTTVLFAMLGIVYSPVLLLVAALFGVVTYVLWTHGTGRLAARIYAQVQRQAATDSEGARRRQRRRNRDAGRARAGDGGFGAGPRGDWEPPGDRRRQAGPRDRRRAEQRRRRDRAPRSSDQPTAAEAYRTLGLDPGADRETIKRAYREKVKTAHPDTESGDKEQFKDVKAAYERLVEE